MSVTFTAEHASELESLLSGVRSEIEALSEDQQPGTEEEQEYLYTLGQIDAFTAYLRNEYSQEVLSEKLEWLAV